MATPKNNPLLVRWAELLKAAGIDPERLELSSSTPDSFGDGEAILHWRGLLLRLAQDRGHSFVDVGASQQPGEYFTLDDLGIAFGWRRLEDVISRTTPIPLETELLEIAHRRDELESAHAPKNYPATSAAIQAASARRGQAFLDKLKRLADKS